MGLQNFGCQAILHLEYYEDYVQQLHLFLSNCSLEVVEDFVVYLSTVVDKVDYNIHWLSIDCSLYLVAHQKAPNLRSVAHIYSDFHKVSLI